MHLMTTGQVSLVKVVQSPPWREGLLQSPVLSWAGRSSVRHLTAPNNALGIVTAATVVLYEAWWWQKQVTCLVCPPAWMGKVSEPWLGTSVD